jgi:hypothetical protein
MYIQRRSGLAQRIGPAAGPVLSSVTGIGQTATVLPDVTRVHFRNGDDGDTPHEDNCCAICRDIRLGVRQNGTASNGMEMIFTLSGHRRGIQYDIVRTVRASLWGRLNGVWTPLARRRMGAPDDRTDNDECLIPRRHRIFAIDAPGFRDPGGPLQRLALPAAHIPGIPANATDLVLRHSFAEWVIARSTTEGIPWTRLKLPPRRDGSPRSHIYWHSSEWLTRDRARNWDMDIGRSRIRRGSLSAAVIDSPPA